MIKPNQVIHGDCLKVLKTFPDNCIDTIITDPPYGIGFMGKEWDNFKPTKINEAMSRDKRKHTQIASQRRSNTAGTYDLSLQGKMGFQNWMTEIAKELFRVTKPGGTMLIFGGTRTYHRLACAIEDAGWIIKDCIMWIYGSGFPKAEDTSKSIDEDYFEKEAKKFDKYWQKKEEFGKTKEGRKKFREWKKVFKKEKELCRGVKGSMHAGRKSEVVERDITEPFLPQAKLWSGWKSHGLKPAYEPILVAMKPNEGSYAQNALKYGVAGLNIDGGRIPSGTEHMRGKVGAKITESDWKNKSGFGKPFEATDSPLGRFPANIILDEEAAKMLDEMSGESGSGKKQITKHNISIGGKGIYGGGKNFEGLSNYGDIGGASRFFKVIK